MRERKVGEGEREGEMERWRGGERERGGEGEKFQGERVLEFATGSEFNW